MCVLCNQFYKQRNDYGILKNWESNGENVSPIDMKSDISGRVDKRWFFKIYV